VSNAEIDDDIKGIQSETDQAKRQALISKALAVIKDQYLYIPLHQQVVVWAARSNVDVVQMADNFFPLRFVTVK
jgi:peptide/nickel transport system substrate-binding protein